MNNLNDLGWQLVWFDQLIRALIGVGLILVAGLAGWPTWASALVAAIGGILLFEAVIRYCPLARIWPWNR